MIRAVDPWATNFNEYSNPDLYGIELGDGVLMPTQCEISEEAGGSYTLTMTHPVDPGGVWRLIRPMGLICAPIPVTETPPITPDTAGLIGVGDEVWSINSNNTSIYGRRSQYQVFKNGSAYYKGQRVSHNGHNWECITSVTLLSPGPENANAWKDLGAIQYTIKLLSAGTQIVVTSDDGTYLRATTLDGTSGYVRKSDATYMYTIEEGAAIIDDIPERVLTHQLFRVTDITLDGQNMTAKVTAQHVSYDWSMVLIGSVTLKNTALPAAIAAMRSAALPDGVSSAPAIYAEATDNTITAGVTRKSVTSVLLDPAEGFVHQARAKLVRDGRDFFLLSDTETDRGVVIRYGVNLQGVTWRRDYSKLVTRVMPISHTSSGVEYLLPEIWVDSPRRDLYPVDAYQILETGAKIGTDGNAPEVREIMREKARKLFEEQNADLPVTTLTVDFLMLGDTEEFAQYRGLDRLNLYDTVEIIHPDLGLSTRAQVKSYTWDAINRRYTRITLGDAFENVDHTVYGYNLADGVISARKLTPEAINEIRNG